ncbi:MAG: pentapeptide repeat-containing protein [Anaerolineales bacterium]|nr:pentapeptide repeat-containing protein [Anaerolineales bacterium]
MKWERKYWLSVIALLLAFASIAIIYGGYVLKWEWVGMKFVPNIAEGKKSFRTFWDWLDLLIVPLILALGAWWLNRSQKAFENQAQFERLKQDREIAQDRQQQALLDGYFDRMTDLILNKALKDSEEGAEIRNIARTHTLSVLRNLDGKRKGQVLRFLNETGLIHKSDQDGPPPTIPLYAAELRGADLIMVPLRELYSVSHWTPELITRLIKEDYDKYPPGTTKTWSANLHNCAFKDTDFSHAAFILTDLSGADFDEANLNGAILALASLWLANLRYASLRGADLRRANLFGAEMHGVDLLDANLEGADLKDANLKDAKVTNEQLLSAKSLENATMPNGEKYHAGYFSKGS